MIANSVKSYNVVVKLFVVCFVFIGCIYSVPRLNASTPAPDPAITIYGKSSDYKGLFPPERYVAIAVQHAGKQNVKLQEGAKSYRGIMVESNKDKVVSVVVFLGTTGKYPQHPLYLVRMDVHGRVLSGKPGYAVL